MLLTCKRCHLSQEVSSDDIKCGRIGCDSTEFHIPGCLPSTLKINTIKISWQKNLRCLCCGKLFLTHHETKHHYQIHHQTPDESCYYCNQVRGNTKGVLSHICQTHNELNYIVYECRICHTKNTFNQVKNSSFVDQNYARKEIISGFTLYHCINCESAIFIERNKNLSILSSFNIYQSVTVNKALKRKATPILFGLYEIHPPSEEELSRPCSFKPHFPSMDLCLYCHRDKNNPHSIGTVFGCPICEG